MLDRAHIRRILDEYKKSIIVTEQEVRSKLLVPLIEALEYESEFRAEEFPVYGFEGRKRVPTKMADYVLFNDSEYNNHRDFNQNDIEWVQNHSLLIVEAKSPDELPEVDGQAQFYTMWTRTLAYIVSDGVIIRGFYHVMGISDIKIFSCKVDELDLKADELICFSKLILCDMKQSIRNTYKDNFLGGNYNCNVNISTNSSLINIHRTKYSLYDAVDFEKQSTYSAKVFIDNDIMPIFQGKLYTHKNSGKVVFFESELIDFYIDFNYAYWSLKSHYHVLGRSVEQRVRDFNKIDRFYKTKKIKIVTGIIDDFEYTPNPDASEVEKEVKYWIDEMNKLREIEIYYDIHFDLKWLDKQEEINMTYQAIDYVYCGIIM